MRLSILIFDGLTSLDAIGGYEVLSRIPGMEVEFFARSKDIIAADTRRLGILAYRDFEEVKSTDILYVPGGPGATPLETDEVHLAKIRELDRTTTWTVGICNGVGLLAAAGLLRGQKAATNWFYQDRLAAFGVEFVPERFHQSGKYVTGAGVSASIDTALFLTNLLVGEQVAKTIQLGIEYYPAPPFPERTAAEAPEHARQLIKMFEAHAGPALLKTVPPFEGLAQAQSPK
jgi:transcriptional regulator GlxA family with amidase domain